MNSWDMYTTKKEWTSFQKTVAYGIPLLTQKTPIAVQYPFDRLRQQFRLLQFAGDEASIFSIPDLTFHGELYVFANKYLVESLPTQRLKSLHCDLCEFPLNEHTIHHILDLFEYTYEAYEETGRSEPAGDCSLRDLVITMLPVKCEHWL